MREAKLIGQILACPQCGSMVLVEPPPPTSEPPDQPPSPRTQPHDSSESLDALSASFDQINDIFFDPQAPDESANDESVSAEELATAPRPVGAASPSNNEESDLDDERHDDRHEIAIATDWTQSSMQPWRPIFLTTAAAVLGLVMVIGSWRLISSWQDNAQVVALKQESEAAPTVPSAGRVLPSTETTLGAAIEPSVDEYVGPTAPANSSEPEVDVSHSPAETVSVEPAAVDESVTPDAEDNDFFAEVDAELERAGNIASIAEKSPPSAGDGNSAGTTDTGPIVETSEAPFADQAADEADLERVPEGNLPAVNVTARLQDPIARIQLQQVPLKSALHIVSQMSTIPISIRYEGLQHAGVSLAQPVSVDLQSTDVAGFLNTILGPNKLGFEIVDSGLVVAKASRADGSLRRDGYRVGDLLNVKTDSRVFGKMVQHVVLPNSWKNKGGKGRLAWKDDVLYVEQKEPAHYQILLFCERLRKARGLKKASRYPDELFRLQSPGQFAGDKLRERRVSVNAHKPTLLVDILNRIAGEIDCEVLIDWQALRERGWGSDADAILVVRQTPVFEALDELLRPMRLTYRILDAGTLEVTTEAAELTRGEIAMYPVRDLLRHGYRGASLMQRLQAEIGDAYFSKGGGTGSLMIDPVSQHLIVHLPQSRQLMVAQLLSEWRQL